MPRLGEPVPAFEAMTTKGKICLLDDYKGGKWVILFSHPADFTSDPHHRNNTHSRARTESSCELVGLSVDSRNNSQYRMAQDSACRNTTAPGERLLELPNRSATVSSAVCRSITFVFFSRSVSIPIFSNHPNWHF